MTSRLLLGIGTAVLAVACAQSDAGITASVKTQLAADDIVKARNINVDTRDRVVTLTGEVRSTAEETQALQLARNTEGVADVIDQIVIAREAAPTTGIGGKPSEPGAGDILTTDPGITAQVKEKLSADPDVASLRIDVDTRDQVVTLTGTVNTQIEESRALQLAREVEGVLRVTDRITVQTRP
jgi:hyperosmotically inducible protein